jgi:hypothetical protein
MLDNVPVATLSFIAGAVVAVIGYISNDLTVFQALAAVGIVGFGGGKIGEARNGAGRGLRK